MKPELDKAVDLARGISAYCNMWWQSQRIQQKDDLFKDPGIAIAMIHGASDYLAHILEGLAAKAKE